MGLGAAYIASLELGEPAVVLGLRNTRAPLPHRLVEKSAFTPRTEEGQVMVPRVVVGQYVLAVFQPLPRGGSLTPKVVPRALQRHWRSQGPVVFPCLVLLSRGKLAVCWGSQRWRLQLRRRQLTLLKGYIGYGQTSLFERHTQF